MGIEQFDLSGKVAFITGGNGGIGRAMALGFAGCGADVAIAARNSDKLKAVLEELHATGRRAIEVCCNVEEQASIDAAIRRTVAELGGIDIAVNNAGINGRVPTPQDISAETWNSVLRTNLTGAHFVSVRVREEMVRRGGGKIINISSMLAIFGGKTLAAYAASKGGLEQYTRSCAVAWAKDNIQVNAIEPGWIATAMTTRSQQEPKKYLNLIDRTPAGRYGQPTDLVGAAVFLASKASDFVTGACIPVDGGYSIQGTSVIIDI